MIESEIFGCLRERTTSSIPNWNGDTVDGDGAQALIAGSVLCALDLANGTGKSYVLYGVAAMRSTSPERATSLGPISKPSSFICVTRTKAALGPHVPASAERIRSLASRGTRLPHRASGLTENRKADHRNTDSAAHAAANQLSPENASGSPASRSSSDASMV